MNGVRFCDRPRAVRASQLPPWSLQTIQLGSAENPEMQRLIPLHTGVSGSETADVRKIRAALLDAFDRQHTGGDGLK
jgi:hypothetical protein